MPEINTDAAVRERYSAAAQQREQALCCPVTYDPKFLQVIPTEVIERDYGCGDPSKYVKPGETVLDLGSGGGKICFIASQVVGASGSVIGVDKNDEMLKLARNSQSEVASRVGFDNVRFLKGRIQDLQIDLDHVDKYLGENPIHNESDLRRFEAFQSDLRVNAPMIPDNTVDVVVSNCVLNLVDPNDKAKLFAEIFRVLRPGGRAVISDIVSDEMVPQAMQQNEELWSGCISGAYQEKAFLDAFIEAGFEGVCLGSYQEQPWRVVEGIEFRSVTVIAYKFPNVACLEHFDAVVYRGPFASVCDDDGHTFRRGVRSAVCRKTFEKLQQLPYANDFIAVSAAEQIAPDRAQPFPCRGGVEERSAKVTKGGTIRSAAGEDCCASGGCC